jgi:heme oxygenase
MKKIHRKYSEISSFDDFHSEKEKLKARGELAEAKLRLTQSEVKRMFSVASQFFSLAREVVLPKISDLIKVLIKKVRKEPPSEPDNIPEGEADIKEKDQMSE